MQLISNNATKFGKSLQSGRHVQCVLALILNKQGIDTRQLQFPSNKWSETCTTTLILLISVSFQRIWGGGRFVNIYPKFTCVERKLIIEIQHNPQNPLTNK